MTSNDSPNKISSFDLDDTRRNIHKQGAAIPETNPIIKFKFLNCIFGLALPLDKR